MILDYWTDNIKFVRHLEDRLVNLTTPKAYETISQRVQPQPEDPTSIYLFVDTQKRFQVSVLKTTIQKAFEGWDC